MRASVNPNFLGEKMEAYIDTDRILWIVLYINIAYIVYLCITIKSEIYEIKYRIKDLVDRKDKY